MRFGPDSALGKASPYADMVALGQAMAKGEIDVLVLGDVNPVYAMPPSSGFAEALAKVPMVVSLANRPSETTARAHVVLPALSWLESWGDYEPQAGVVGLMQPTMAPVEIDGKPVDGKSVGDLLLSVGRQALGSEEGKGPLPWASSRGAPEGGVEGRGEAGRARQGVRRFLGGDAQARRHVARDGGPAGAAQARGDPRRRRRGQARG